MFKEFKKIHFVAYALFFFGKLLSLVAACCIFSHSPYLYVVAPAYVFMVFGAFICGMYDQSRTHGGYGFAQYFGLTYTPKE